MRPRKSVHIQDWPEAYKPARRGRSNIRFSSSAGYLMVRGRTIDLNIGRENRRLLEVLVTGKRKAHYCSEQERNVQDRLLGVQAYTPNSIASTFGSVWTETNKIDQRKASTERSCQEKPERQNDLQTMNNNENDTYAISDRNLWTSLPLASISRLRDGTLRS